MLAPNTLPRLDGSFGSEPRTPPLLRRCNVVAQYCCTACGFAPRLKRKPSVCAVVLAALRSFAANEGEQGRGYRAMTRACPVKMGRHRIL